MISIKGLQQRIDLGGSCMFAYALYTLPSNFLTWSVEQAIIEQAGEL